MVEACTNLDLHSHSCFLLPRPKCSSLELLFSPSPPDSKEKLTHFSWARSLVDRPFMLLAHFRGSYIICVFLLVYPFSLFSIPFQKRWICGFLWGLHTFCGSILGISHTKQFQSCQRQLSLLGFIQFVTIDDLLFSFPFGSLVLRYFEDSLWISYIIPLTFLPHEWMEFQFPHEGSSSVNGLERARLFKSPFPYE